MADGKRNSGNSNRSVSVAFSRVRKLEDIERQAILTAVRQLGVRSAAAALGISKATIHRKLRSYQYERVERESDWRVIPTEKLSPLLVAAAKATDFLKWCQGTIAPGLAQQLDAALGELQNWLKESKVQLERG